MKAKDGIIKIIDNEIMFEYGEYKVSKRSVKVSNVFWGEISKKWLYGKKMKGTWEDGPINNTPCKAEITGETCTIVELTKE